MRWIRRPLACRTSDTVSVRVTVVGVGGKQGRKKDHTHARWKKGEKWRAFHQVDSLVEVFFCSLAREFFIVDVADGGLGAEPCVEPLDKEIEYCISETRPTSKGLDEKP